jgi:hypothetical protein
MGIGSKKHKGPAARAREKAKGKNVGPKRVGKTKPPPGLKPQQGVSTKRLFGKKAKKAAARAAAYAIIDGCKK